MTSSPPGHCVDGGRWSQDTGDEPAQSPRAAAFEGRGGPGSSPGPSSWPSPRYGIFDPAQLPTLPLSTAAPTSSMGSSRSLLSARAEAGPPYAAVTAAAAALVAAARAATPRARSKHTLALEALRQKQELALTVLEQRAQQETRNLELVQEKANAQASSLSSTQPLRTSLSEGTLTHPGPVQEVGIKAKDSEAEAALGFSRRVVCSYDEVERCIDDLQSLVKACRMPRAGSKESCEAEAPRAEPRRQTPQPALGSSSSQSSRPKVSLPAGAVPAKSLRSASAPHVRRKAPDATAPERPSEPAAVIPVAAPPPDSARSEGDALLGNESSAAEMSQKAEDLAARARCEGLHVEVAALRDELRKADIRIQGATSEAGAANSQARENRKQHQRWIRNMEDEAAKLRREGQRLERSFHQASLEERRMSEIVRSQPAQSEEKLTRLKANCERLQLENERLEHDLETGRSELSSVRQVVTNSGSASRAGPPPRATVLGASHSAAHIGLGAPDASQMSFMESKSRHLSRESSEPLLRHGGRFGA
eukprot:TRINITY_DN33146_c0_g1_i1.p1 TRINITY_DN33146_c0_g1~~TRINITY_DN33146_c0_g1_i1.p1  ORF type:complete len:536 (-),score=99.02 TRINITY_DN33146_c0_g1_i1:138-1745(-)